MHWTKKGHLEDYAKGLVANLQADVNDDPNKVYNDHISVFRNVNPETFKRNWKRFCTDHMNSTAMNIFPPYDLDPEYDPTKN